MERGKRLRGLSEKVEKNKKYPLSEAVRLVKGVATAKFDETVEVAMRLGVDPKQSDQNIRGAVSLPHGIGKKIRVLVFAKGEKEREATQAGADFVGGTDLIEKIQKGWTDFDATVATPDMMKDVGKLGKILGIKGLMPNPKLGTVTFDVGKVVKEIKAGRIEYRVDKGGNIHAPVGKASFEEGKLLENVQTLLGEVVKARPSSVKGQYIKGIALSTTMGPGIRVDLAEALVPKEG
jgi:large subunit ribosomal protein L1